MTGRMKYEASSELPDIGDEAVEEQPDRCRVSNWPHSERNRKSKGMRKAGPLCEILAA